MLISSLPVYNAPNYAPVKPLLELRKDVAQNEDAVCSQFRALYEELDKREESLFHGIAETAYTISSFIQGKQIWQRNWYRGGAWELAAPDPKANPNQTRSFNKMQFQISQMLEDIISSNPDFEPADMFRSYEAEKQVKASKALWNHYERRFYAGRDGAWFNNQQAYSLITTGTAIEELVYDTSLRSINAFRDIWGEREIVVSEGGGECFGCGFQGSYEDFHQWGSSDEAKEFAEIRKAAGAGSGEAQAALMRQPLASLPQCSRCGSFETSVEDRETAMVPTVIGVEQFKLGDFRLNNLPIQAVRYDPSVRPEDSPYLIDKQYVPLRRLKHLFGRNIVIGESGEGDIGLDYLEKMARIGASIGGARVSHGASRETKTATLVRMSLSAEELAEIDIPRSSMENGTVSGGELPSGGTFADICPEGGTVLGFNGLQHIYGIYPVHHKKRVSSAFYFSKANSGTGRGAEDLTEIQKRWNRFDAQQAAAIDGATPGYAFVEGAVDEKHLKRMGFPNAKIPVKREFFNATKTIDGFVKQFAPQQVAPQFFAYAAELEKMMQMTAHNVSMSGSVFDANNNTATGARILEAAAQAITIPMLQSKAGARAGTIHNLLCGYKQAFASVKRKFSLGAGGSKHSSSVEAAGDEINSEIEFVVVENSMIPQNFYVRRMDYMAFASAVNQIAPQGGYLALKATDPELLKIYSRAFNVDMGGDAHDRITEICRERMQNAFELAELFGELIAASPASLPPQAQTGGTVLTESAEMPNISAESALPDAIASPEDFYFDIIFESLDLPIRPLEKDHGLKAEWFREHLDTQEGVELDPMKRDICFEFVIRHQQAERDARYAVQSADALTELAASGPQAAIEAKIGQMMMPDMPAEMIENADSLPQV